MQDNQLMMTFYTYKVFVMKILVDNEIKTTEKPFALVYIIQRC